MLIDEIYVSEFTDDPKGSHERLSEAVERALFESNGLVKIESPDGSLRTLSAKFICPIDGSSFPEVEPRLFSLTLPTVLVQNVTDLGLWVFSKMTSVLFVRERVYDLRPYVST